jgi:Flp pilus assembly protein TadG
LLRIKQIARKLGGADGQEILEVALVLPLVFMLLLGIVEFGRVFNIYSTIQQAAQQGALAAAREPCATCPNGNTPPGVAAANNAVTTVIQASNLSPSNIQAPSGTPNCATGQTCSPCPSPPFPPPVSTGFCSKTAINIYVCQNVQLNPAATNQPIQCGTVVSFKYPFTFTLPFTSLNAQTITLSAQAQSRMEN